MDKKEVAELIKAIKNRCEIYLMLCNPSMTDHDHLLPTILEDIHEDSQAIAEGFCVEKND